MNIFTTLALGPKKFFLIMKKYFSYSVFYAESEDFFYFCSTTYGKLLSVPLVLQTWNFYHLKELFILITNLIFDLTFGIILLQNNSFNDIKEIPKSTARWRLKPLKMTARWRFN